MSPRPKLWILLHIAGARQSSHCCPCPHRLTMRTLAAQVEVDLSALGDDVAAAVAACSDPDAAICPSLPQLVALLEEGSAESPGDSEEARQLVAEVAGVQQLVFRNGRGLEDVPGGGAGG